ncbi:unnamed protein product [Urochloa humidicola]
MPPWLTGTRAGHLAADRDLRGERTRSSRREFICALPDGSRMTTKSTEPFVNRLVEDVKQCEVPKVILGLQVQNTNFMQRLLILDVCFINWVEVVVM